MKKSAALKSISSRALVSAILTPKLANGEHYAGIILKDGRPSHHLVLLPPVGKGLTWDKAVEFAKKQKGELPTRQEQSLLFANCKQHIEGGWYWSCEPSADGSAYAWHQSFRYGTQYDWHKDDKGRVRLVRRVPI